MRYGLPCEDAISRQVAQEAITMSIELKENPHQMWKRIQDLPPVTPQPKTGYWIKGKYRDTCSECRYTTKADRVMGDIVYDFCPFCGVKMIGSEEQA